MGLDVDRRGALGLCGASRWPLVEHPRKLELGARSATADGGLCAGPGRVRGGQELSGLGDARQCPCRRRGLVPVPSREVYQPSYAVSRGYFDNMNRSNAVIAPATITDVYNTTNVSTNTTIVNNITNVTQVVYANQQVAGAVVAMPVQAFAQSEPVARALVSIPGQAALNAPVAHVAGVAPVVAQSVVGSAAAALTQPPVREQAIVTRTALPPPSVPFALQQKQLAANPGEPIDEAQRTQLKPSALAEGPSKASLVTMASVPKPAAVPPAIPPAGKSPEARKVDFANAEALKAEAAKAETLKGDAARTAAARSEASKADAARLEAAKADVAKAEAAEAATAKAEASKAEPSRAEAAKANALKDEAAKAAIDKAEASKADAVRAEAARAAAAKTAMVRPTVSAAPPAAVRAPAPNSEPDGKADAEKTRAEEEARKR